MTAKSAHKFYQTTLPTTSLRRVPNLWNRRNSSTSYKATGHIINKPIDEEFLYDKRLEYFHPTQAGDVLDGRFKTIAKLGFGAGSTAWLAENLKFKRFRKSAIPRYVSIKIPTLDSNASECHLIHTDIKDDNILVTIENDSVLADFVKNLTTNPQPRHVRTDDGRVIYLSQDDFGPLRGNMVLPALADFNQSFPGLDGNKGHLSPIQSHRYRAPEVLLGCPWSYSVDIWNFGLVMWNMLESTSLFESIVGDDENPMGRGCETMNEYWGGPFFDENVIRKDLTIHTRKLEDTITELEGDEKYVFLDFASSMLQWLPEKRKTAKELLQHRFFDSLEKERERYFQSHA
ncbi:kinase domain-containing protein [Fusarium mundagurra]|uniref:Kinase domain-containing protein n=1 Tax=Fusarium mundagurra TaxID=1567541 RepID=A0A8H5YFE0_9HYPO|nr:kinase domain-containing protein [Fusarium mundagurra]